MLNIWLSSSFGFLGVVLLYRRFDWFYSWLCLIIGTIGCYFPMVLIFPYFLIVWRVVVGRYIHTNSQLFIGERRGDSKPKVYEEEDDETDSFSNSLSHWIVAIKIPAEADSLEEPTEENHEDSGYLMAHAVDEVISGRGKKINFRKKATPELEKDYVLHHVGWVTRKQRERHIAEVVDNEPMVSGYSCQEFAVDIAFQISCSRTYTYIKSITLVRLRTMVYYTLVLCSALVFLLKECFDQPITVIVEVNPQLFNPATITNLFIATEVYRLGYTNLRQEKDWKSGLIDRLNVYFNIIPFVDKLKLALLLSFSIVVQLWMKNIMLTVFVLMVCIIMAKV
ncbi:uncharacterized protein [Dysidea avara]|uniref:uncharacterized protein n=1 Tax=Dysidea avara TaxID=196820 RepID=UPI0033275D72